MTTEAEAVEAADFFGLLGTGEAPRFVACGGCGELTTLSPCWRCTRGPEVERAARDRLTACGIPARFRWAFDCSAATLADRVSLAPVAGRLPTLRGARAAILAHTGPAVVFTGPSGAGKTSFAVACLRSSPRRAFFVAAADLERARIEHSAGHGEAPIVARAMRAKLLVIDDLGQDKPSSVSAVEAVLLARHNADAPTWITTGLGGDAGGVQAAIEARYNSGIARRLTEEGTALVVGFGGAR
jgi:hypothetical protein